MKLQRAIFLIAILTLGTPSRHLAATPAPAPAKSWSFVVTMADLLRPVFDVSMTVRGYSGDIRLCLFMPEIDDNVSAMRRIGPGPAITYEDECWDLRAVDPQGTRLSYKIDLHRISERKGAADYVQRIGESYVWNDQAVFLHPMPYPHPTGNAPRPLIDAEFHLPPGVKLVTPWTRLDAGASDGAARYRFDCDQHDGGSYITMGRALQDLGAVTTGPIVTRMHLLNLPHRPSSDALRAWIAEAMRAVAKFYGDTVSKEVVITLVPVAGSSDPGVFGTVVRRGTPSVLIYFGADCTNLTMAADWVAVHELFHIGNPLVENRIPWLSEGVTTYYQDILRMRAHVMSAEDGFGDLYDGFRRFCQPESLVSIGEESRQLPDTHRYTRVYWGGACVAFLADVAIRARTAGKRSLDDAMLKLRRQSLDAPLDEAAIIAVLDEEVGDRQLSRWLSARRLLPVVDWLRRLGIEPTGPASVRFHDDAPLAAVRKAMIQ